MIASPLSVLFQVYPSPGQSDVPVDTVLKMKFTEADSNVVANSGYTITLKGRGELENARSRYMVTKHSRT